MTDLPLVREQGHLNPWFTPKWIARLLLGRSNRLVGRYVNFEEALSASTYPDGAPVSDDLAAARDVLQGQAAYCRDGMCFSAPPATIALSALGVLAASSAKSGNTRILDFGGGAASLYLAYRPLWEKIRGLSWHIVEREQLVSKARTLFSGVPINWHTSLDEACAKQAPDIVVMSSVLQYMPDPTAVLQRICDLEPAWLVIDRTPVVTRDSDTIALQRSPRTLHDSSYPSWIFGHSGALRIPRQTYECIMHKPSDDPVLLHRLRPVRYHGWLYRLKVPNCD